VTIHGKLDRGNVFVKKSRDRAIFFNSLKVSIPKTSFSMNIPKKIFSKSGRDDLDRPVPRPALPHPIDFSALISFLTRLV